MKTLSISEKRTTNDLIVLRRHYFILRPSFHNEMQRFSLYFLLPNERGHLWKGSEQYKPKLKNCSDGLYQPLVTRIAWCYFLRDFTGMDPVLIPHSRTLFQFLWRLNMLNEPSVLICTTAGTTTKAMSCAPLEPQSGSIIAISLPPTAFLMATLTWTINLHKYVGSCIQSQTH